MGTVLKERPKIVSGVTPHYKFMCGNVYIICNYIDSNVYEIFIKKGHGDSCSRCMAEAVGGLCANLLQMGINKEVIIDNFKGVNCGFGIWEDGHYFGSCLDAVAKILSGEVKLVESESK